VTEDFINFASFSSLVVHSIKINEHLIICVFSTIFSVLFLTAIFVLPQNSSEVLCCTWIHCGCAPMGTAICQIPSFVPHSRIASVNWSKTYQELSRLINRQYVAWGWKQCQTWPASPRVMTSRSWFLQNHLAARGKNGWTAHQVLHLHRLVTHKTWNIIDGNCTNNTSWLLQAL